MALVRWRLWLVVLTGGVVLAIVAAAVVNPRLTRYVEGQAFREELDRQTSKGLHFQGQFKAIRRTGLLTARTEGFTGSDGVKAIKAITTGEVEAKFNPWGVFLRRWQLDYVRIPSGRVEIQTYEPKPENKPSKPWYAVFLPDRVYLKKVTCDVADVTWQLRGRKAGFFTTRLMLTPHGRDFNYRASGGTMKTGVVPDLALRQVHLLVTKELLTLYELELAPNSEIKQIEIEAEGAFHPGHGTHRRSEPYGIRAIRRHAKISRVAPAGRGDFRSRKRRLSLDDCQTGGKRAITSGRSEPACGRVAEEVAWNGCRNLFSAGGRMVRECPWGEVSGVRTQTRSKKQQMAAVPLSRQNAANSRNPA